MSASLHPGTSRRPADDGFMLLAAIVMIFLVLLTLSIAAPRIAKQIQHDHEVESAHRAKQYVRAIRVYYLKFKHYPGSMEQLEKTNNQRFLRQKYVDPLTGKDNWRLIHVGENQTTVKGFFGEDLPGLQAGLGSASGMQSSSSDTGNNMNKTGGMESSRDASTGTTTGASTSQSATDFKGGGGQIMGIGSSRTGESMLAVDEQSNYETWEFLYDPRIEQLYAKSSLLGGIASGSGSSGGFGTPIGTPTSPTNPTPPTPPFGSSTPR